MRLRESSAIAFEPVHNVCPPPPFVRMSRMSRFIQWGFVVAASIAAAEPAQPPRFDVLIRNGRVMDGTGNPWIRADVAISGDRIAAMGNLGNAAATRIIDAQDRV